MRPGQVKHRWDAVAETPHPSNPRQALPNIEVEWVKFLDKEIEALKRGLLVHSIPRIQIQRFNSKQLCYFPFSPRQLLKEPLKSLLFNQSVYTVVQVFTGSLACEISRSCQMHSPIFHSISSFPWRIMPSCLFVFILKVNMQWLPSLLLERMNFI